MYAAGIPTRSEFSFFLQKRMKQMFANCRLRNLITQGLMIQPDGTVAYKILRRPMVSRLAFY